MEHFVIGRLLGFGSARIGTVLAVILLFFVLFSLTRKRKTLLFWLLPLLLIIVCCEALDRYIPQSRGQEFYCLFMEGTALLALSGLVLAILFGQRIVKGIRGKTEDEMCLQPLEYKGIKFTFRRLSSKKEIFEVCRLWERITACDCKKDICMDEFSELFAAGGTMLYHIQAADGQLADICIYVVDRAENDFNLSAFYGKARRGMKTQNMAEVPFVYRQGLSGGKEALPEADGMERGFVYFYPLTLPERSLLLVLFSDDRTSESTCKADEKRTVSQEQCRKRVCEILSGLSV